MTRIPYQPVLGAIMNIPIPLPTNSDQAFRIAGVFAVLGILLWVAQNSRR
jgi:hypothetical protein